MNTTIIQIVCILVLVGKVINFYKISGLNPANL